jgi:hypothetical protein
MLEELRLNYDGYLFHVAAEKRVYNPDMVLYHCDQVLTGNHTGGLIGSDRLKTDYAWYDALLSRSEQREIAHSILKEERIATRLVHRMPVHRLRDAGYLPSIFYYLGLLTIRGMRYGQLELGIPNYAVKSLMWDNLARYVLQEDIALEQELAAAVSRMAYEGELEPLGAFLKQHLLLDLSNRDLRRWDEKYIKLLLMAMLNMTRCYLLSSEREVPAGYVDLLLRRSPSLPDIRYEWLLELKYVKESERHRLDVVISSGIEQLSRYAAGVKPSASEVVLRQGLLVMVGKTDLIVRVVG